MVTHFRFVRDHQKDVKKVALVTDSHLGDVAERLASHFISAEIRHFPAGQTEAARQWIMNGVSSDGAAVGRSEEPSGQGSPR
jgi:hypothetical protein